MYDWVPVLALFLVCSCLLGGSFFNSLHAKGVFITHQRIETLRRRVNSRTEPTCSAWVEALKAAEVALGREPQAPRQWYVPGAYVNSEGHNRAKNPLRDDANAAYALALAYRITAGEKYAAAAVRLLNAWATETQEFSTEADSCLCFSYHFPAFIFAADLLRRSPSWLGPQQDVFRKYIREKALPMNTMARANNWGNWGLLLHLSCAASLDDLPLFEKGVERWKQLIDSQIADDGHLVHEVNRGSPGREGDHGIWYSHFSLMPQTIAAEIARVNGVDLYDYQSPRGRSLRMAYEWLGPFVREPQRFPYVQGGDTSRLAGVNYVAYWEILNNRWPNADAAQLIRRLRPLTAGHSAPFLTFTHGDLPVDSEATE
ncbi:MAG: alginate lyase family protein [Armatimonadota bacterium]|nr:MAG: alginate lyase family protein [Armatimonadota bacterium]